MASQVDNVLLDDSTTGLPRTIDVGSDSIVLSTDLTLQAGGVFIADNVKRGTADPNAGPGTSGNEGDVYQRTLAGTGELWVNSDGTPTGWVLVTGGGSQTLAQTLTFGNTTGGTDIIITDGDEIVGQSGASLAGDVVLRGGTATSGVAAGGDIFLTPGTGVGGGVDGIVQVNGLRHYGARNANPISPAPAQGDRYYNTVLQMEMQYDSTRAKWLSVESVSLLFGRNGFTFVNAYYRGMDGLVLSPTIGFPAFFNGTVVAFGYTRSDVDAATFQVMASGGVIYSLASAAVTGFATNANSDFTSGQILSLRNAPGGNTTTNVQAWVRIKWRA
jgi:hypothetical protein